MMSNDYYNNIAVSMKRCQSRGSARLGILPGEERPGWPSGDVGENHGKTMGKRIIHMGECGIRMDHWIYPMCFFHGVPMVFRLIHLSEPPSYGLAHRLSLAVTNWPIVWGKIWWNMNMQQETWLNLSYHILGDKYDIPYLEYPFPSFHIPYLSLVMVLPEAPAPQSSSRHWWKRRRETHNEKMGPVDLWRWWWWWLVGGL